jgi:hypothetical protein
MSSSECMPGIGVLFKSPPRRFVRLRSDNEKPFLRAQRRMLRLKWSEPVKYIKANGLLQLSALPCTLQQEQTSTPHR